MKKNLKLAALVIAQSLIWAYMMEHLSTAMTAESYADTRSVMYGAWLMVFLFTVTLAGTFRNPKAEWACMKQKIGRVGSE